MLYPLRAWTASYSARFGERLAVDASLALKIVDRDVGVVPREARSNAKALGQLNDTILGEPCLGGGAALPEVDAPVPASPLR